MFAYINTPLPILKKAIVFRNRGWELKKSHFAVELIALDMNKSI